MTALTAEQVRNIRAINWKGLERSAVDDLADTIDALESRCADKDASIAQLIEQLQKAEARNAELERANVNPDTQHGDGPIRAGSSVVYGGSMTDRTSEGAK